jgi:hypothetical protein
MPIPTVATPRPPEWPVLIGFYAGVVVLVILPQVRVLVILPQVRVLVILPVVR